MLLGHDRQTSSTNLVYATGQASPRPSPDDPHVGFDRWTSLVEVCASTTPTSLNSLSPLRSSQLSSTESSSGHFIPSPSSMVRAPLSDGEDDHRASQTPFSDTESFRVPRNRKKHACELCEKAFDRPSTLKTHLLVHTGITPFSCHLCGRRFGVQSNCNRHIRRCTIREELFIARRAEFQALQSRQHTSLSEMQSPCPERFISRSQFPPVIPKPKRPRRKRSPSPAWIPNSLNSFKISTSCPAAPLPLPPVRPRAAHEERDSYISYHEQPYTEEGWTGRLPGPAPLFDLDYSGVLRRRYTSRT